MGSCRFLGNIFLLVIRFFLPVLSLPPEGGILPGIFLLWVVSPGSPNPEPISDNKLSFTTPVFRPSAHFSKVAVTFRARKAALCFPDCIQDQTFNNFENDKMELSDNEAKLTGL